MKPYEKNSPQAISQVLAMMMIIDAKLDDSEIEMLDELRVFDLVGISRAGFSEVLQDYCAELMAGGTADGRIRLVDEQRINEIIGLVDDHATRVSTCGIMLNIANADGLLHDTELAVFKHVLDRWNMTLDSLERDLTRQ